MNFLIDTNICSAYLKGDPIVWNKFMQYSGGLVISVVTAGELRGTMLDKGTPLPDMDALIASTALVGNLTLVTHNVADFQPVPDLRIEDWLV